MFIAYIYAKFNFQFSIIEQKIEWNIGEKNVFVRKYSLFNIHRMVLISCHWLSSYQWISCLYLTWEWYHWIFQCVWYPTYYFFYTSWEGSNYKQFYAKKRAQCCSRQRETLICGTWLRDTLCIKKEQKLVLDDKKERPLRANIHRTFQATLKS